MSTYHPLRRQSRLDHSPLVPPELYSVHLLAVVVKGPFVFLPRDLMVLSVKKNAQHAREVQWEGRKRQKAGNCWCPGFNDYFA